MANKMKTTMRIRSVQIEVEGDSADVGAAVANILDALIPRVEIREEKPKPKIPFGQRQIAER